MNVIRTIAFSMLLLAQAATAAPRFTERGIDAGLSFDGRLTEGGSSWGDFDSDGCLDLAVNRNLETHLLRSECLSTPHFTPVGATHLPGRVVPGSLAPEVTLRSLLWGDLNNDGHVDLLRSAAMFIEVSFNEGPLVSPPFGFRPPTTLWAPSLNAEGLGLIDVDADGWLDVVAQTNGAVLFRNPADGGLPQFDPDSGLPTSPDNGDYLVVGDYDVDGDVDLVVRLDSLNPVWTNVGGRLQVNESLPERSSPDRKGAVLLCDFDDDGDFDVFWSAAGSVAPNRVWVQGASGQFALTGEPMETAGDVRGAACGDLDNDGDLDLLLVQDGPDGVWLNESRDGRIGFRRDDQEVIGTRAGRTASLVDADRDGDLDVYLNQNAPNELWENTTDGRSYLMVRVVRPVGAGRVRDDVGATLHLEDCTGARRSGVREVNGGQGRGGQGSQLVHFGLPLGPELPYVVVVRFVGGPVARRAVVPSRQGQYQLLTVSRGEFDELSACPPPPDGGGGSPTPLRLAVGCGCSAHGPPLLWLLAVLGAGSTALRSSRPLKPRRGAGEEPGMGPGRPLNFLNVDTFCVSPVVPMTRV